MASIKEPKLGLNYFWALGETEWKTGMDSNILQIGALLFLNVVNNSQSTPPVTPNDGDCYIPIATATDEWVNLENYILHYDGNSSTWLAYLPKTGWIARDLSTQQLLYYNGASWVQYASLYGSYANDSAAATGSVPLNGIYVNSSTGALTVRKT